MRLRPIDLAREHGLSTQAVRNYEEAGFLPPAERSPSGYRVYAPRHAAALRTFLALIPAYGHAAAGAIMRAVNGGEVEEALRLIDAGHARLAEDRSTLEAVEAALRDLEPPSKPDPEPNPESEPEPGVTFIGPLADRLGIRPATLRAWERAGLIVPLRDPRTGYRLYTSADVRDVLLAHQLRRGGHGLERIARVLEQVRTAGGPEPLRATLREWRDRLTARGLAMLAGAAALDAYLTT
ncbi:MerR family DNA-binding transcriptional regulator [Streptomyces sp. UNOB3_S3]|uniref:MerR family DNA-binding transcriptional regulator n=1 Tax=Streptomyces sp. UNOB3_S3 TaxID=2871682 RepID=UPI001E4D8EB6|nr:MerR family DNA-binding transcriptional regulator [Streptomyces sp. UNOB3_S3]MCC3773858.1 MerR family DNA-binding transcriptional regulator [Streptomyces sp. UNOB3_S3]